MDQKYKPVQKKADQLRYRMKDVVGKDSSPEGSQLIKISRDVLEDIECSKSPRAVESRIEQLKRVLEHFKSNPTDIISPSAAEMMSDDYEDLRRELRAMPNY